MRINKSLITQTTGGGGSGSVTSVGLSVTTPTGLTQVVTGSPVTSSGTLTLALSFTAGYAIPTTLKQTNWDDAYTWVSAFPTTTGNPDEVLYTDGSTLSWSKVFTSTISATGSPNSSTFLRGDGVWSTPTGFANPMTTLGDTIYGAASGIATRLAGNTTTTRRFLMSQGSGTISAAPIWDAVTKTDVGLSSVENTALSTWAGTANITTVGTIATGTWNATTIAVNRGGTGATTLTGVVIGSGTSAFTAVAGTASQLLRRNIGNTAYEFFTITKSDVGLANVENTALSTWAGSSNITTVGTIATGTWGGTAISIIKGGTGLTAIGTANQLLRVNAGGTALEYFTPSYLTANQTITLSGNVTGSGTTAITTTIANNVVTNAMLSQVATATFKGRVTAATGNVEDLTATQATSLLNSFSGTSKGLVPANPSGLYDAGYYLNAVGSWGIPTGPNIYNSDGSLGGNRFVDTQIYTLYFTATPSSASTNPVVIRNANISGLNTTACLALDTNLIGGAVDIRFGSTNPYALRMYASNSNLTTTPVGAGFQLFNTSSTSFPGHIYFDSGANDNAKINFRTAPTSGTISTRMEINALGQLKLNTYTAITSWTTGVLVGYLGFDSSGNIMTASGTGGGSTNVSIGQSVTGGVSSNILYVSSSQTLAQSSNFLINGSNNLQANDGANVEFGTTTGTILGITSSQKLAFWGATPIVRPSTGGATSTFTPNTGTAINASSTFDGYTLGQIVKALRNIGLLN